jgi:hypothetical protein
MSDNTLAIVIVDGTRAGYAIDLATRSFGIISSPYFYGADVVRFCDTYFLFNYPKTAQWYISLSNASFQMLTGIYGSVQSGHISGAGTGYANGTYTSVALTGGSGTGALATVTVTGGVVTNVTITTQGINYVVGDVLGANYVTPGSGFSWIVDTVGA